MYVCLGFVCQLGRGGGDVTGRVPRDRFFNLKPRRLPGTVLLGMAAAIQVGQMCRIDPPNYMTDDDWLGSWAPGPPGPSNSFATLALGDLVAGTDVKPGLVVAVNGDRALVVPMGTWRRGHPVHEHSVRKQNILFHIAVAEVCHTGLLVPFHSRKTNTSWVAANQSASRSLVASIIASLVNKLKLLDCNGLLTGHGDLVFKQQVKVFPRRSIAWAAGVVLTDTTGIVYDEVTDPDTDPQDIAILRPTGCADPAWALRLAPRRSVSPVRATT